MDMTKFEQSDDPGFTAIAGELCQWVKELIVSSNTSMPEVAALQQQQVEQQQYRLCM